MKHLILFFALVCSIHAANWPASSPDRTDVNNAINLSSNGDTVTIPAGSATWTSGITVTKSITIIGSGGSTLNDASKGTDATTEISGNNILFFILSPAQATLVRVSGIKFAHTSYGGSNALISPRGTGGGGTIGVTNLRIDHCTFTFGTRALNPLGYVYGVSDHCTFTNANIAFGPVGDDATAWGRPIALGDGNAFFFETNSIIVNNSSSSEPNEWCYIDKGARVVIRYNTLDGSAYTAGNSLPFENHGNYGNPGAANPVLYRSPPTIEFYENDVSVYQSYRLTHTRGGIGVFWNNRFVIGAGGGPAASTFFELNEEDAWQTSSVSNPVMTVPATPPCSFGWPARDQVMFFFSGNTRNGSAITGISLNDPSCAPFIQSSRDYFSRLPQNGDSYYTYVDGYTGSTTVTQALTNYTPYTYPNPLVTSTSAGGIRSGGTVTIGGKVTIP